ncbi:dihydrodipicolinate synthase family protein [Telmatobacter bradus]|uniref:dihydrodipicolinate synthase family protein n=1 Tax=Telmatobacter bradus TaxID=474953 RepID=UPI003B438DB9
MARTSIGGVFAAVLVPRDAAGRVDERVLDQNLGFLQQKGIQQFAVNGATGEFCRVSREELELQLRVTRSRIAVDAELLCGVGAGSLKDALELAHVAAEGGATALLAPMPYFFPYAQDDLEAFAGELADKSPLPVLLYNLPQFTSGLKTETVLRLLREHENLVGVKDSSGSLEIMRAITREGLPVARILGNDGALAQALAEGVCDGVVSGVACVLPEVIQSLFAVKPEEENFQQAAALLRTFIEHIDVLPTPWGLKVIAEARLLAKATFPLPLSARRVAQSEQMQAWFQGWLEGALNELAKSTLSAAS